MTGRDSGQAGTPECLKYDIDDALHAAVGQDARRCDEAASSSMT